MWHCQRVHQRSSLILSDLLLGLIDITGSTATLATSLTGTLVTGLEATAGGVATLGSDVSLLPGVHAGETTLVAGLASLASNALDLLLRAVGKVSGVLVSGHFELI